MRDYLLRHSGLLGASIAALVIVPLAFLAAAAVNGGGNPAPGSGSGNTPPNQAASSSGVIQIEEGDLYIKPTKVDVQKGQKVTFHIVNKGSAKHDFKLEGTTGADLIDPGGEATVELGPFDGPAKIWCTVPGHRQAGMVMDVNVAGEAAAAAATTPAAHDAGHTAATTVSAVTIDPNATPGADWKPFDPALQPAPGGTEHKLTIEAQETVKEVAPGVKQQLWTFNGQTPGPILRGKVGDIFTITLVNKGTLGHSIDLHASKVAWNDEMRTINPGESLVYQFEAKFSGIFMYHCGTAPALHHIGNGMFGAIIIDPPDLPAVDHEYVFIQSELYLGADSQPGDLTKMQNDDWDAVVFNEYYNQYKFAPIRVEPGERVRAWVLDAGPSENSSFHIVGTIFDTVYKEGAYDLQPGPSHGGSQALDLQPAQGGFVEFTFDEAGLYPIVTHKFSNASNGALGLFQAGEVAATSVPAGH